MKLIVRDNPVQDEDQFTSFAKVEGGTFHKGLPMWLCPPLSLTGMRSLRSNISPLWVGNLPIFYGNPDRPVEGATWFKALEYCNRRNMQGGHAPCYGYGTSGTDPEDWPSDWEGADGALRESAPTGWEGADGALRESAPTGWEGADGALRESAPTG